MIMQCPANENTGQIYGHQMLLNVSSLAFSELLFLFAFVPAPLTLWFTLASPDWYMHIVCNIPLICSCKCFVIAESGNFLLEVFKLAWFDKQ